MIYIPDDNIRAFCAPVLSIEYLAGQNISKTNLSEKDYLDLRLLYAANEFQLQNKKNPYMNISKDDNGVTYAKLTFEGIRYSESNEFSFILQSKKLKDIKKVPLYKAKNLIEDNLEEKIICNYDNEVANDNAQFKEVYDSLVNTLVKNGILFIESTDKKTSQRIMSINGEDLYFSLN